MEDPGRSGRAIVHDMRNHLAVAVANLEAFADGVLVPTPERIRTVLEALSALDAQIERLYELSTVAKDHSRVEEAPRPNETV